MNDKALEDLRAENPETKDSMNDLLRPLVEIGEFDNARNLFEKVIHTILKLLGQVVKILHTARII
jgi:hypothetical protein